MKKELKARWIKALRSDKYKQGKGNLILIEDGEVCHCCLGVLRDIVDPKDKRNAGEDEMLTPDQLDEYGLDELLADELAERNDGGCTFVDIADLIEKRVK